MGVSKYANTLVVTVGILLCCSLSVPATASWLAPLRTALSSLPFISIVTDVSTHTLTQVRYSYLSAFLSLAVVVLFVNLLVSERSMKPSSLPSRIVALCVFSLVALASCIICKNMVDAVKALLFVLFALSIGFCTKDEKTAIRQSFIRLLIIVGAVNAFVTICQFFILTNGTLDFSALRTARPDGIFCDSILSATMSAFAAFALVVTGQYKMPVRVMIVVLLVFAGVVTGARTFYYLLIFALAFLIVFYAKGGGTKLLVAGALAIFCFIFAFVFADQIGQIMDTLSSAYSEGKSGRDLKTQLSLSLFVQNPVFGIGTGQYAAAETSYYGSILGSMGISGTNPHNIYLQILCENGLAGFIPFATFLVLSVRDLVKQKDVLVSGLFFIYLVCGATLGILYSMSISPLVLVLVMSCSDCRHCAPIGRGLAA